MENMTIQISPEIIAHRGVHNTYPENTIPAFEDAITLGADAVELDVRLSADGIPVVYHYYYLDEVTSLSGPVFNYTWGQFKQARFKCLAGSGTDLSIPSLAEVLDVLAGRIGLEIEIKGPEPEAPTITGSLLNEYRHFWDRMEVTSYEPMLLENIHRTCPGITTDLLIPRSEPWMRSDVLTYQTIQRARMAGARAVHLHPTQLSQQVVEDIQTSGIEVHAWDVNTEADWESALALGIPRVDTDNPALMMRLAGRR